MSTYLELKAQLAIVELKIEIVAAAEKPAAIREIQARMAESGIALNDLAHFLKQDGVTSHPAAAQRKAEAAHAAS